MLRRWVSLPELASALQRSHAGNLAFITSVERYAVCYANEKASVNFGFHGRS